MESLRDSATSAFLPVMAIALQFFRPAPFPRLRVAVPLVSAQVSAGFPSPADDHLEGVIDLTELLITDPPATFLIRASGLSMTGRQVPLQIHDGDLLVVNRALTASNGHIIVA